MPESTIRTIEINGVKLDIDLRQATIRKAEALRIGSKVKVLTKTYSGYDVKPGVVIGFDAFQKLPSIQIATACSSDLYSVLTFNANTTETEVVLASDEEILLDRDAMLKNFDRQIEAKKRELETLRERKALFERHFGEAFISGNPVELPAFE
jgi:hypothetical protein